MKQTKTGKSKNLVSTIHYYKLILQRKLLNPFLLKFLSIPLEKFTFITNLSLNIWEFLPSFSSPLFSLNLSQNPNNSPRT